MTPPAQSCCNSSVGSNPPDMSRWNPFGEDNFSKLTEEELIDREFDLLRASRWRLRVLCLCSRHAGEIRCAQPPLRSVGVVVHTEKPVETTAASSVDVDRPQPAAKPLPPEDLFGLVPFVTSAGKS